jgi:tetratricopeptide (TPR) repeat protein
LLAAPTKNCPNCDSPLLVDPLAVRGTIICAKCRHRFTPGAAAASVRNSGKAVASLALGLGALFALCLSGIPAIVLGVLALRDIHRSGGQVAGRGWAIAGIASGILFGIIWTPLVGAMMVLSQREIHRADLERQLQQQVQIGRLEDAAVTLEALLRRRPDDDFTRYQGAALYLYLGNPPRYQELCRELLDNSRNTNNPATAERAAKVCLATAHGLEERQDAFERAERGVRLGAGHRDLHWFELARGMSAFRQDDWNDSLRWLDRSLQGGDAYRASIAETFRAMALHRLGRSQEAIAALSRADAHYSQLTDDLSRKSLGLYGPNWHDALLYHVVRREAELVLGRPSP